jgi:hypothetical protein
MNVRSWANELNGELDSPELTFLWLQQWEYNLKEISKVVKERSYATES